MVNESRDDVFASIARQLTQQETVKAVKERLAARLEADVQYHLDQIHWGFARLSTQQCKRWDELVIWARAMRAANNGLSDALRIIRINEANRIFWQRGLKEVPIALGSHVVPPASNIDVATRLLLMR